MFKNRRLLFWGWACFLFPYFRHDYDTYVMIFQCVFKLFIELKIFSLFFPIYDNWFNFKIEVPSFSEDSIFGNFDVIFLTTKDKFESTFSEQNTIFLIFFTINNQSPWMTSIASLHFLFCWNDRFWTRMMKNLFSSPNWSFDQSICTN